MLQVKVWVTYHVPSYPPRDGYEGLEESYEGRKGEREERNELEEAKEAIIELELYI